MVNLLVVTIVKYKNNTDNNYNENYDYEERNNHGDENNMYFTFLIIFIDVVNLVSIPGVNGDEVLRKCLRKCLHV